MLTASVNHARAMRIAEIIADFRSLQHFLASIRMNPSADEYDEEAYIVLRQCAANANALLAQPFNPQSPSPQGDEEAEKIALQQIILDASVRRFKAQQIYLRASAALRWVASRNAILGGQQAQPVHQPALQQILNTLRAELSSITMERIELSLRSMDTSHGKWMAEDPSLQMIQHMIQSGR
ncbi:hypothetical protein BDV97DRAFT_288931 [Delphinella strobiligena]|nr:hypothetical protein BDV97DRAFT_288931 [Delphinella strobiligena]